MKLKARNLTILLSLCLTGLIACGSGSEPGAESGEASSEGGILDTVEDAVTGRDLAVPSGTRIHVRLNNSLDSGENRAGDTFSMTVSEAVQVDGETAIPSGAVIFGTVTEVQEAKRPQKGGKLVLSADRIRVRGEEIPIDARITASGEELEGEGSLKEDLKEIAIGAGAGAALGGLLKGGKGALAGVIIGGAGTFLATKGEQIELPPETPLIIELRDSIEVPAAS